MSLIYDSLKQQESQQNQESNLSISSVVAHPVTSAKPNKIKIIVAGSLLVVGSSIGSYVFFNGTGNDSATVDTQLNVISTDITESELTTNNIVNSPVLVAINSELTSLQVKSVAKSEVKVVTKTEVKAVTKPEVKSVTKPEVKAVTKPEVKSVTKPEVKAVVKPEVKSVAKPEVKSITKPAVAQVPKQTKPKESVSDSLRNDRTSPNYVHDVKNLVLQINLAVQVRNSVVVEQALQELEGLAGSNSLVFHRMNAYWLLRQEKHAEAAMAYQQLLFLKPDDLEANINLGFIEVTQGNANRALDRMNKMQDLYPDSTKVEEFLVLIRARNGR